MRAGRQFSSFCSKVQLLSVRFVIILILSLFVIYQKVIFRDGQQLEKFANKYELALKYEQDTLSDVDPPFKQILFWNDYWGIPDFRLGVGRDAFRKWGCPVWQCETSTNRTNVHDYDAVIFHMRGSWNPNDLPKRRTPQQRYVFWILESAGWPEYLNTSTLGNFFNWTLTYRWDSDMVMPYGYVRPTGNVPLHPSENQLKQFMSDQKVNYAVGKTKMAAWFVSNCVAKSSRNEMVKILQKYIQIDVYGVCGNLTCPKEVGVDNSSEDCRNMAGENYKFYMALENSLCHEYISEKFFGMLHRPVIPVVFGLHDHYDKIAPSHSYINAAKFENMRQLADYLILLDRNDTLYNEYFWWKPHFESRYKQKDVNIGMCHLCASLHNKDMPPKVYPNMTQWWDEQSSCINSPPIL
ncbi:alpha-(1,3)-fucosyltransferase C-like [Daphnia pulicaria]|uniref:alpha-(1,3)-fucosyltransferase C-like n=1 Tax=Daphnia pulicaria TaxID=35523 RepID=UPI001EEC4D43|nr:alpha-(1,3)-fucosyltransferase C-like [Daphnia pulicaria]